MNSIESLQPFEKAKKKIEVLQKVHEIQTHQNFILAIQGVAYEMWEELRQHVSLDLAIPVPDYMPTNIDWRNENSVAVWLKSSNEKTIDFEELISAPHVECTNEGLTYKKDKLVKLVEGVLVRVVWDFTVPYTEEIKALFTAMGIMKTHTSSSVNSYTSVSCEKIRDLPF